MTHSRHTQARMSWPFLNAGVALLPTSSFTPTLGSVTFDDYFYMAFELDFLFMHVYNFILIGRTKTQVMEHVFMEVTNK